MNPVRCAVIGCGKVGHFHAIAFRENPTSELVACLGRNPEKTKAFADEYGIPAYTDLDEMIEKEMRLLKFGSLIFYS